MTDTVRLDGRTLRCAQVDAVARAHAAVTLSRDARQRVRDATETLHRVRLVRPVYGHTTGVGANRSVRLDPTEQAARHGARLIRSHTGGAGPVLDEATARAMLVVRLNQLAAGGSGVELSLLDAIVDALNAGRAPRVPRFGSVGTGDLEALAAAALTLRGERPWLDGTITSVSMAESDALPFMSSNAASVGESSLFLVELYRLLDASMTIASLSFLAMNGNAEAYQTPVVAARPHPGLRVAAARMRALLADHLAGAGHSDGLAPARVQDSYALRAFPQVHGVALDSAWRLEETLTVELNAAAENPLIDPTGEQVLHNGNFHAGYLAHALDAARAACHSTATLSAARLAALIDPANTGLSAFLAAEPAGSSGVMILEYTAHGALAELRAMASPVSVGAAVLSRGVEEHASFAAQAAWQATRLLPAYATVLACELVAAMRALRMARREPRRGPLRAAYQTCLGLPADLADRPLDEDLAAAEDIVRRLGAQQRLAAARPWPSP